MVKQNNTKKVADMKKVQTDASIYKMNSPLNRNENIYKLHKKLLSWKILK